MTISVRQSALAKDADNAAPWDSPTLGLTPVEGNLMCAVTADRSGATDYAMSSGGWTLDPNAERYQSVADGTFRKSHAHWYKKAGASEPTSCTVTMTDGGAPVLLGIAEFQSDAGEMAEVEFATAVCPGSDTAASFYDSGNTTSVSSTNKLLVAFCYTKVGSGTEAPYSDWSAGADPLTEFVELDDGVNGVDGSWAWGLSANSGVNSVRATKDVGTTDANRGAIVSLLVFTIGPPPEQPEGTKNQSAMRAMTGGRF